MQKDKELEDNQTQHSTTDPQEDEKNGNVFGPALDALFGNAKGDDAIGQDEANDPDKQESIKE